MIDALKRSPFRDLLRQEEVWELDEFRWSYKVPSTKAPVFRQTALLAGTERMIFGKTQVAGAFAIDLERRTDERGFFARSWCQREFEAAGLECRLVQINVSHNVRRGTLRGMHFQLNPHEEAKVVSCTQGAIFDVVLDLRPKSPTYLAWTAEELTAENHRALYIPKGCAHGFQTLADDTQVLYLMSEFYSPSHGQGVRYDDSAFGIKWPLEVTSVSDADRSWPTYQMLDDAAVVGKVT